MRDHQRFQQKDMRVSCLEGVKYLGYFLEMLQPQGLGDAASPRARPWPSINFKTRLHCDALDNRRAQQMRLIYLSGSEHARAFISRTLSNPRQVQDLFRELDFVHGPHRVSAK